MTALVSQEGCCCYCMAVKKTFPFCVRKNMDSRLHFVETVHIAACTSGRISRCLISRIETAAIQCFCCKYKTAPRRFQSITCCLLCGAHAGWKCGTAPFLTRLQLHNATPRGCYSCHALEFYLECARFEFMTDSDYTIVGFTRFFLVPPEKRHRIN